MSSNNSNSLYSRAVKVKDKYLMNLNKLSQNIFFSKTSSQSSEIMDTNANINQNTSSQNIQLTSPKSNFLSSSNCQLDIRQKAAAENPLPINRIKIVPYIDQPETGHQDNPQPITPLPVKDIEEEHIESRRNTNRESPEE